MTFKKYTTYIEPTMYQAPNQSDLQTLIHLVLLENLISWRELRYAKVI